MAKICQMCGTSNRDELEFCSACGSELPPATGAVTRPESKVGGPAKTMIMGAAQPPAATPQAAPKQPAKPAADAANKTMLGLPAMPGGAAPKPESEDRTTAHGIEIAPKDSLPPPKVEKPPMATVAGTHKTHSGVAAANKTMLGMQAITGDATKKSSKPPLAKPAGSQPAQAAPSNRDNQHTMLGMPAITGEDAVGAAPEPSAPKPTEAQKTEVMPKKESKADPAPEERAAVAPEPADLPSSSAASSWSEGSFENENDSGEYDEWPDEEPVPRKKPIGLIVGVVGGGVALILLVIIVVLLFRDGSVPLTPQVFRTADGEKLTVVVSYAAAPEGTVLRIKGQDVPVNAGQARFDMAINALNLGPNNLEVEYVEPGKSPVKQSFQIALRHTITTDANGLATANPFVVVNFKVAPEISLAVNGQPVQLNAGAYTHTITLSELAASAKQTGDNLVHKVPFQIQGGDGVTEQGEHVITIPLTNLQIDRPADEAVVDTPQVTCTGLAEPGSQVTVDGNPIGMSPAGFSVTVPLPNLGERRIQVTARAPGKAPNTQTVSVTRIESLKDAIADWAKDLDKSLDYPTLGRNPNSYINQKVKLRGRVVSINTQKGVTAFVLYVADGCPKGAMCAAHVAFHGETDAGLQSWVNVYGLVSGTHVVDLSDGSKLDVPSVEAKFVVKTKPGKKRGR